MPDVLILNQPDTEYFPNLLKGDIHLWTISLDTSEDQIERLRSVLSPAEKKKASYYKFEPIQHHYIVTQAVLRMLLSAYLDIGPADIKMGAHKKGKPFLVNDASIFYNISNSHDLCVYAFSRDGEVGVDIEKIRDMPDIDQLIEKNLTIRERKYFQKDTDIKLTRFFQFWTFKESYLKAIGEGMRLTPENLEFSLENGTIRLRFVKYGFDAADWQFKGFTREGNYTGALAYTGKETVIREMSIALKR
ncbi:MAG: 4'-phosphopantetheinyl transferase superfamily protein [Bacteroidales bacterium]|nr:4'-phosphopantetheinyl transferase superfamily protein [Bacteroidales bacterium]